MRSRIYGLIMFLFAGSAMAQDVHFTQFHATPLFTNPALAGQFNGTYRYNVIARRQWASVSKEPYQTLMANADMNALFNWKPLGGGLILIRDQTGASAMTTTIISLPLSIVLRPGKSKTVAWSLAAQPGWLLAQVDPRRMSFGDQFNGSQYDPSNPSMETMQFRQASTFNLGAGTFLKKQWTPRRQMGIGFSMFNILNPDVSVVRSGAANPLPRRQNVHAFTSFPLNENLDIMPAAQFQWQGTHTELLAGAAVKIHMEEEEDQPERSVQAGLWGRANDGLNVSAGYQKGNLYAGASYDFNLSPLRAASGYLGGWEFAIKYTHATVREKAKRKYLCPDYL